MPNIADYDSSRYDYTKYWKGRQYEHQSEIRVLKKLLPKRGRSILDIGGAFGRLTPIYQPYFDNVTIADYSQNMLDKLERTIKERGWQNTKTTHADVYLLPFADSSFECVIMVRVLHHLEDPVLAFQEIYRVLKPGGIFILELANKIHLKALIRAYLHGDFGFRSDYTPIKHSHITKSDQSGIFYNYHPDDIIGKLANLNLITIGKSSSSNLRLPLVKRLIPTPILLSVDQLIAPLFTRMNLAPSLWLKLKKQT